MDDVNKRTKRSFWSPDKPKALTGDQSNLAIKLMAEKFQEIENDDQKKEQFGEIACYLFELAFLFSNVIQSSFGNSRNREELSLPLDAALESKIRKFIGAFKSNRYLPVEYTEPILSYQYDMCRFIFKLQESYTEFKLRQTVTPHLFLHAFETLLCNYENEEIGLAPLNCSAFEKTHSKFKQFVGDQFPRDKESEAYRVKLFQLTTNFNSALC